MVLDSGGSVGDSCDNVLAEIINGLFKAEIIHRQLAEQRRNPMQPSILHMAHPATRSAIRPQRRVVVDLYGNDILLNASCAGFCGYPAQDKLKPADDELRR